MSEVQRFQSLERALLILEVIAQKKAGYTLAELSKDVSIPKSTVVRFLYVLCKKGYVEQDENGKYKIGLKMVELVSWRIRHVELKIEARPALLNLLTHVQCAAHLATLDDLDIIYLDKLEIDGNFQMYSQIGLRNPSWCTALGKSLLMMLPEDECYRRLKSQPLFAKTGYTTTNPDVLMSELKLSRARGWSLDNEENEYGVRCIAAPIFDYKEHCVAAISTSGPKNIISPNRDIEISEYIKNAAQQISVRLGFISQN